MNSTCPSCNYEDPNCFADWFEQEYQCPSCGTKYMIVLDTMPYVLYRTVEKEKDEEEMKTLSNPSEG